MGGIQHWLASLAVRAGLPNAGSLSVAPAVGVADAWRQVSLATRVRETDLAQVVAAHFGLPLADLATSQPAAAKLVPQEMALRHLAFPTQADDRLLTVATANPLDLDAEQRLAFMSGRRIQFSIAPPDAIRERILTTYSPEQSWEEVLSRVDSHVADAVRFVGPRRSVLETEELRNSPVVKLTNLILATAVERDASDIHIEPVSDSGSVRFRIDGVLRHFMQIPLPVMQRVISRIKITAGLNIADHLRPQDGSARIGMQGREYDLRISTVPMREAEKLVIRILSPGGVHRLDDLGLPHHELSRIHGLLAQRSGVVLVTGPTGSGKTTTLYACLMEMLTGETNIVSVEDPVEYNIPGISQLEIDSATGMTFPSALRAILRQDPDIVFIGEIRDLETAEIAVQASMTGHLVLATIHANDAVGVVARLRKLGLPASSVADTLRGSISQRLVRRVCVACMEPTEGRLRPEETELAERFGVQPPVRAVGCARCGGLGYRGRIPVLEVLTASPKLGELVAEGASRGELEREAVRAGMRPILEVALDRVRNGETTLQEVERVLGGPQEAAPAEPAAEAPPAPSGPYVLWVDDDAESRFLGATILGEKGFQVREADDGEAALGMLRDHPNCQLVVLDLHMPRLDGREVLARMRRSFPTATIPVIVLTGATSAELEMRLLEEGADDYLRKPADPDRLLARIHAVLRRAGSRAIAAPIEGG